MIIYLLLLLLFNVYYCYDFVIINKSFSKNFSVSPFFEFFVESKSDIRALFSVYQMDKNGDIQRTICHDLTAIFTCSMRCFKTDYFIFEIINNTTQKQIIANFYIETKFNELIFAGFLTCGIACIVIILIFIIVITYGGCYLLSQNEYIKL